MSKLDEAVLCEGEVGLGGDDEVVGDVDVKELGGLDEVVGKVLVLLGGFGGAGGVVVGEDDGGGEVFEGGLEDVTRVDEGFVEGADGDGLSVDELAAGV